MNAIQNMNRKEFITLIKKYGFISTRRWNGSHEIFKSDNYNFNFAVPAGVKEIKKGIYWNFCHKIRSFDETL